MKVYAAFGGSRTSGGVKPEGYIISAGGLWLQFRSCRRHQLGEAKQALLRLPHHYDLPQVSQSLPWYLFEHRQQNFAYQKDASPRVVEKMFVFARFQKSIGWHRHCANLDNAEEGRQKLRSVQKHEHNPLFLPHTKLTKRVARPVGPLKQLLIAYLLVAALNRSLASSAFEDITIHEIGCDIECFWQVNQGFYNLLHRGF